METSVWWSGGDNPSAFSCTRNPGSNWTKQASSWRTVSRFVNSLCRQRAWETFGLGRFISASIPEGPLPRKESDTKACFGLGDSTVDTEWSASATADPSGNTVSVSISPPPTAPIGLYSLTLEQEGQKVKLGEFTLLFNAWCRGESLLMFNHQEGYRGWSGPSWLTGDAVYMRSETKRKEYVLAQHGLVYRGTHKRIKGTPWNYGQVPRTNSLHWVTAAWQSLVHICDISLFPPCTYLQFDPDILDICMMILDSNPKFVSDADQDCSARSNPIYVTRVLSAMVGRPVLWKELDICAGCAGYHGAPENPLFIFSTT